MNAKHRRTLAALFTDPLSGNIKWREVEAVLRALGAEIEDGGGSRVHLLLNGRPATFHRPYPRPDMDKGALRRFLLTAGCKPEE